MQIKRPYTSRETRQGTRPLLRKHYRDELDTGQIKATAKVAESLFRNRTPVGRP